MPTDKHSVMATFSTVEHKGMVLKLKRQKNQRFSKNLLLQKVLISVKKN